MSPLDAANTLTTVAGLLMAGAITRTVWRARREEHHAT